MKQSRKDLLQNIYDHDQMYGSELVIYMRDIPTDEWQTLNSDVTYLLSNGYIRRSRSQLYSHCLVLTEKGEQFVENGFKPLQQMQSSSFNFSGATINNAIIGNDAADNELTMNVGTSISELKELIASKPFEDQEILQKLLSELEGLQNTDEPIQRNFLSRFSDIIKKHTDLIVPLGQSLIALLGG